MKKDKKCFLIIGPESSGTKFLTKCFIGAGCDGDNWHSQKWDKEDPTSDFVVYRKSFPHGGKWPNLSEIKDRFEKLGYEVFIIIIVRSLCFSLRSRKKHMSGDLHFRFVKSFGDIGCQINDLLSDSVYWLTYEALVNYQDYVLKSLFGWCGLNSSRKYPKVKDGNKKYV